MHYTLSLTPRMLTIAAVCFILLCVLMFLLGMEIGRSLPAKDQATLTAPAPATVLNSIPKELPLVGAK
jgi:hypothetical protein